MPKERKRDKSIPEEQKKDRIKEIMGQIEHGIQDVFQSGRLDEYLRIMGKFRRYSLNNTMLIFLQCPNASYCAGYRMWQDEFGRYVKKGEKGIKILAPYTSQKTVKEALNKSAKCEKSGEIRRISPENCKYRPKLSNL